MGERTPPRTKAAQRLATRRALLHHARLAFAADGYAATSLQEVTRAASVTKGALYHQFAGKEALFSAVCEQVLEEVAEQVAAAATAGDPWEQLVAGCERFLRASTDPSVQRIVLIDAPAVLGWEAWRELDARTSMRELEAALTALIDDGVFVDQPVAPLLHLLSGAMNEAALWLTGSEDLEADLAATMRTLERLLAAQRTT